MSFLGILTSNQSTKTRIALHKKVCCWDTGSVLHFPVPVYPPQTRQLYWRGAGKGGGWGVEVTRADTMCLSDPVRGGGRLLPAAALLATPAPTLAATRAPAPAPVVARTPWSCETGPAPAVTRQQQPSKCGVETRGPEPHCYCLSGGKVHVSIRLDNLPLVVFSPLPSVCLHRRLTAVQVARVGRWDQASSSAAIVVTRKRPVASLQPGPGSRLGPRLPQDRSCRAVLGAAAARLSSAIHNYHLGRDQPSLRAWPRPDQVTNTRTPELCQAQAAGTQSFQNLRARLEDRYHSGLQ